MRSLFLTLALSLVTLSVSAQTAGTRPTHRAYRVNIIDSVEQTEKLYMDCRGSIIINPLNEYDSIVNVYDCLSVQNVNYLPPANVDGLILVDRVILGTHKGEFYHGYSCFVKRQYSTDFPGDDYPYIITEVVC